jgi:hypothetical protein
VLHERQVSYQAHADLRGGILVVGGTHIGQGGEALTHAQAGSHREFHLSRFHNFGYAKPVFPISPHKFILTLRKSRPSIPAIAES